MDRLVHVMIFCGVLCFCFSMVLALLYGVLRCFRDVGAAGRFASGVAWQLGVSISL